MATQEQRGKKAIRLTRIEAGCYDTLDGYYRIEQGTSGRWILKECIKPHRSWSSSSLKAARKLLEEILNPPIPFVEENPRG